MKFGDYGWRAAVILKLVNREFNAAQFSLSCNLPAQFCVWPSCVWPAAAVHINVGIKITAHTHNESYKFYDLIWRRNLILSLFLSLSCSFVRQHFLVVGSSTLDLIHYKWRRIGCCLSTTKQTFIFQSLFCISSAHSTATENLLSSILHSLFRS